MTNFRCKIMAEQCNLFSNISDTPSFDKPSGYKIDVDGFNIHYEQEGNGKHILLLLPGAMGSAKTDFNNQLEQFDKDRFTLVAWDPPGYGFSRPPNRSFPDKFHHRDAEIAAELMKKLGFSNYSLLGWSDGGITALILAANHPQIIQKLIVIAGKAYITKKDVMIAESVPSIDNWNPKLLDYMLTIYKEDYLRGMWAEWISTFRRFYMKHDGDICKKELSKIQCPTLLVQGMKDFHIPLEHAVYLLKNIKQAKLVYIPEAKHNLHQQYSQNFTEMAQVFLLPDLLSHL